MAQQLNLIVKPSIHEGVRPLERGNAPRPGMQDDAPSHFDIFRAESVSVTSTLFAGGDWRWRLVSCVGTVLVECGGYRSQALAAAAVDLLRSEAWSATVSARA
ncbi:MULTISPECIES: hypothetical protein [unclassified Novosphingobium]|uniref:hypothetical protein n=1 Tax=unclassified Novosphingobium TaxID=2644732 RepID=UPI000A9882D0|nr:MULTISPECIES: hypothetical protein [unclassified Novosphingobium]MPS67103.1 hypothetical protein [Novosphingobium sp.]TCM39875.1 uncharacterized protein YegP (UPF0339 family) [Novosphingobium sp. ST904]